MDDKRLARHLEKAKEWTVATLKTKTARTFQEMIRAEAGAFVGHVKCVIDGKVTTVFTALGEVACVTCGRTDTWSSSNQMDAGHFLAGRRNSVLFEETGIHVQCSYCNRSGGNPEAYQLYMLEVYGQEVIDELRRMNNQVSRKFTKEELVRMRLSYMDRTKHAKWIMEGKVMELQKRGFDYSQVTRSAARELQEGAEQIRSTGRNAIVDIGRILLSKKRLLPQGEFLDWISEECDMEPRTGQRYMRVVEVLEATLVSIGDSAAALSGVYCGSSALYAISESGCPEAARMEVLQKARKGRVTYVETKGIIDQYKRPKVAEEPAEEPEEDEYEEVEPNEDGQVMPVAGFAGYNLDVQDSEPDEPRESRVFMAEIRDLFADADEMQKASMLAWLEEEGYMDTSVKGDFACPMCSGSGLLLDDPMVPDDLDTEYFQVAWAEWKQYRVEAKKKMTKIGATKTLNKLKKWGVDRAIAAIEFSIAQGWQGIYEENSKDRPKSQGMKFEGEAERV